MSGSRAFARPGRVALRGLTTGAKCACVALMLLHAGCVRKIRTDSDTGKDATSTPPISTVKASYSSQDRAILLGGTARLSEGVVSGRLRDCRGNPRVADGVHPAIRSDNWR